MVRILLNLLAFTMLVSCISGRIENQYTKGLVFSNLKSDFVIENINSLNCETINASVIEHVLTTGVIATSREIHDYYSYVGCSVKGTVEVNGANTGFKFDYGGILYLKNGQTIACGEKCCVKGFQYCTWDKDGLKG